MQGRTLRAPVMGIDQPYRCKRISASKSQKIPSFCDSAEYLGERPGTLDGFQEKTSMEMDPIKIYEVLKEKIIGVS